jgi:hypothetical protein
MAFNYSPKIVTDGLVLYLDAANPKSYVSGSTTWNDIARGGNNGTLINGPTFSSANGGSIVFDGIDDYVLVSNDGFGTFSSQTYTVEAWINPSSTTGDKVIFSYDFTSHIQPYYAIQFRMLGSTLLISWNNGSTFQAIQTPNNTITFNRWHHVVGLYESGRQQIYINGQLQASGTRTDTITFYNQPVWIGKANFGGHFQGNIPAVRYYRKAFSAQEVLQNYNATKTRFGL